MVSQKNNIKVQKQKKKSEGEHDSNRLTKSERLAVPHAGYTETSRSRGAKEKQSTRLKNERVDKNTMDIEQNNVFLLAFRWW